MAAVDKKLLKRLKVLYVEDDDKIRTELSSLLENFFGKVYTAQDGEMGYNLFMENQEDIDVVLSDINMPKLNGIQMVAKIRESNTKVPVMFATAYSDNEYLADAIKLKVYDYIIKPIDIRNLLGIMNELANVLYQEFLIDQQNRELEKYKDVIDQNNIVIKTDVQGMITYVNKHFCEITGFEQDELVGQAFGVLKHKDTAQSLIDEMFETVLKHEAWQGKLKNKTKFDDEYIVDCYTIATLSDSGEVTGTISIQRDITAEVNQKREMQRALIKDKSEIYLKGKESTGELNAIIKELNQRIHDLQKMIQTSQKERDRILFNAEKINVENKKLKKELTLAVSKIPDTDETSQTLKMNKSNQDMKIELKKLYDENEHLKAEMNKQLSQVRISLETRIKELEKQNKEYSMEIDEMDDLRTLNEKIEYWKAKAKEGNRRIEELERELISSGDKTLMSRLFK